MEFRRCNINLSGTTIEVRPAEPLSAKDAHDLLTNLTENDLGYVVWGKGLNISCFKIEFPLKPQAQPAP